jgi:hypothetical protein
MKRTYALLAFALIAVGCRGQVPPNPTVATCPASTGTAYALISSPTALTVTDTHPAAGSYCYIAQSTIGPQVSVPSNIAGPFTTSGSNSVLLTWNAPTTGPAPTGYAISRAPAIQSTIIAPALVNVTVAEVKPALIAPDAARGVYARLEQPVLVGKVR